jgi:hypothetical protein
VGMNSRLRKYAYTLVAKRDGEKCRICGRKGNSNTLVVDHIDDNDKNNPRDGSNWQLLCRRHNIAHLKHAAVVQKVVRSTPALDAPEGLSAEMRKNRTSEPAFRHFAYAFVRKHGATPFETLVERGAFRGKCSTVTTRRYLKAFSVPAGQPMDEDDPPLVRYYDSTADEDMVRIRPGAQWKGEDDAAIVIDDIIDEESTGPSPAP